MGKVPMPNDDPHRVCKAKIAALEAKNRELRAVLQDTRPFLGALIVHDDCDEGCIAHEVEAALARMRGGA